MTTWEDILFFSSNFKSRLFLLVNIYAPNEDKPMFFLEIFKKIEEMEGKRIFMGDFNMVLEPEIDRNHKSSHNNNKVAGTLQECMQESLMVDVWRERNPNKIQFTFRQHRHKNKQYIASRLDFVIVEQAIVSWISKCEIIPGYKPDHSAIIVELCPFSIARGVGIWRLNINILEENEFLESMNAQLEGLIKKQEKSIASLADKWEEIKLSLIQTVQDYSHACAADRMATIMQLEKYIQKLELNEEENYHLLLKTKNDYKELLEEKVRGAVFRAKYLWYADSEKSTKYFMNLEKSRSGAKGISAVLDYNKIITHPQQILDRLVDFYSKDSDVIFKYENTEQILISEETQMRIEGNITLEELSTALKSMKRNKAPGCSGLPMEMYVIFWRLIGERLCQSINFAYEKGKLHDSALKGIIILIPKKGKDSRIVANLRPITLLNTDYKLIEKVLANHLKTALTEVISQDQKGFFG